MILWIWIGLSVLFVPLYVRLYKMAQKDSPIVRAAEEILKQHKEKP